MTTVSLRPIVILLCDDDDGDVRLTREALGEARVGGALHVASDGVEALAFLRREEGYEASPRPDLVLLDLDMPRMGGLEVLRAMKADPALIAIPVTVVTTSAAEQDITDAYGAHANAYVTKPMDLDDFIDVAAGVYRFWVELARLPSHGDTALPQEGR